MRSNRFVPRELVAVMLLLVPASACRDQGYLVDPGARSADLQASATRSSVLDRTNEQTLESDGARNIQNVSQTGTANSQTATAAGGDNTQELTQAGTGNDQSASAEGNHNSQGATQDGAGNVQSAAASGDGNSQDVAQDGTQNQQTGVATGDGNTQGATQSGDDNAQSASVDGDANTQGATQTGDQNTQSASADGDDNTQTLTQDGSDNEQGAAVDGSRNSQTLSQYGARNALSVRQLGSDLRLMADQRGEGRGLAIVQQGAANRLIVRGDLLSFAAGQGDPQLVYDQQPAAEPSTFDVVWTNSRLQLAAAGHNALRVHYRTDPGRSDGHTSVSVSTPAGASWQATFAIADLPAAGSKIVRYSDLINAAGAPATESISDVQSVGMRVVSSDAVVTVVSMETVRLIDTRVEIRGGARGPIPDRGAGVIPVVVFGHAGLDVSQIDPASLDLLGMPVRAAPRPRGHVRYMISFEDHDGDGFIDAMVHFDQSGWSLPPGTDADDVVVSGTLLDGSLLLGTSTGRGASPLAGM